MRDDFLVKLGVMLYQNPDYRVVFGVENHKMYFQVLGKNGILWKNERYCHTTGIPVKCNEPEGTAVSIKRVLDFSKDVDEELNYGHND